MEDNFKIDTTYYHNGEIDIDVTGALNTNDLSKIEKIIDEQRVEMIRFDFQQSPEVWREINRMIKSYSPKLRVSLYFYDLDNPLTDLSFLQYLPDIEDLGAFYFRGTVDHTTNTMYKEKRERSYFFSFFCL